jgi:hypothetical protein
VNDSKNSYAVLFSYCHPARLRLQFQGRFLSRDSMDRRPQIDLIALAREIAETPCSLIKYESSKSMTLVPLRNRSADT